MPTINDLAYEIVCSSREDFDAYIRQSKLHDRELRARLAAAESDRDRYRAALVEIRDEIGHEESEAAMFNIARAALEGDGDDTE